MRTTPLTVFLLLLTASSAAEAGCSVCGHCLDCTLEVLADGHLEEIEGLLRLKIDSLGQALHIRRLDSPSKVTY